MKNPRQGLVPAKLVVVISLLFSSVGRGLTGAIPQTSVPANELGRFLILEYHLIQDQETRWGRSFSNFKQDLELL
jgi:hypothetical protein